MQIMCDSSVLCMHGIAGSGPGLDALVGMQQTVRALWQEVPGGCKKQPEGAATAAAEAEAVLKWI